MKSVRKSRCRIRFGTAAAALILASAGIAWRNAEKAVRPAAEMQAEEYAKRSVNEIVASAVSEYLDEAKYTYGDFATVLYDENGRISSIEASPYAVNKAQAELTKRINKRLRRTESATSEIPIGSLSGKYLLAGKGPKLKLKILPASEAEVKLVSEFASAGMNQTCHKISAIVATNVRSSTPLYSFDTNVEFEFLLAESVIIGEVPQYGRYAWAPAA